jgi:hypothetical protein
MIFHIITCNTCSQPSLQSTDVVLRYIFGAMQSSNPREQFYWGYIWDGTGNRVTQPIRNPHNKSHMPAEQVSW